MRSACKKQLTQKNPTLLHKLKELAAEVEDDEEIVSELKLQEDSDNSDDSRYHITNSYTIIKVLIYQTGYTSPTIVHSLTKLPQKKDRWNKNNQVQLEKGNLKIT